MYVSSKKLLDHTEITNQMQPCTRIYYSSVYQLLNMFSATHRSSSGAQNCNCRCQQLATTDVRKTRGWNYSFQLLIMSGVSPETCWAIQRPATTDICKIRGCNYSFELLMMSGVLLETCWAIQQPETTDICKIRGCNYSFELQMMIGVSLETCWAIKTLE